MKILLSSALGALLASIAVASTAAGAGQRLPQALTDAHFYDDGAPPAAKVELGRLLFHDKILSGNRNISCATCHHALAGTGDGLSLPVGEGGTGLGVTRDTGTGADAVHERVPRNAPPVFNLGAREFVRMFHDGRAEVDPGAPSGFLSPAGDQLPAGLDNVLAVQAMFPVTSGAEMAGQASENLQGRYAAAGELPALWELIAQRLREIPAYVEHFRVAFDDVEAAPDITYVHAANAIAAFEASAWRADDSPFDRFLRGRRGAMSHSARRGMRLFYGKAGCARCHAGPLQTDHGFHAIAMPQIGPGKGDGPSGVEDHGRERVTGDPADRYRFRTPSLRNVALTGPWGHDGAYGSLRAVVKHHLDPVTSLRNYEMTQLTMPGRADLDAVDGIAADLPEVVEAIASANQLEPPRRPLREKEIDQLLDFLHALTDRRSQDMGKLVPPSVPSGLPLYD